LAQSIGGLQDIVRTVRTSGASLKTTEQPIDTGTAAGKCFLDMLGVFAEFETNLLPHKSCLDAELTSTQRKSPARCGASPLLKVRPHRADGRSTTVTSDRSIKERPRRSEA
jgi:Resolvase, N terminal domain